MRIDLGSHRFLVKEIAVQAGVSTATVDRVLNNRLHVRHQTRIRVMRAVAELERLQDSLNMSGDRFLIDVVVEAPDRFAEIVRAAVEAEIISFRPAPVRPRFHLRETWTTPDLVARLRRIGNSGSKGVLLKAKNLPDISGAIGALRHQNVPTATLVTDIPDSARIAYAGMDNVCAGETASYLMSQFVATGGGTVLVTISHDDFLGEADRVASFRQAISVARPDLDLTQISGGHGQSKTTRKQVSDLLERGARITGVYSAGGGNRAILEAFDAHNAPEPVVIGHDLDDENRVLLRAGRISALIVHDLNQDIRQAFGGFISFHKPKFKTEAGRFSSVQIMTPANIPEVA